MPMMPFIGVRISWLMFARNVLFHRVAASALLLGAHEFPRALADRCSRSFSWRRAFVRQRYMPAPKPATTARRQGVEPPGLVKPGQLHERQRRGGRVPQPVLVGGGHLELVSARAGCG